MRSEQLGSIYRGIGVKTVVMFAKSISILLFRVKMVALYVPFSLFMPLGETLYWLSKTKGEKGAIRLYVSCVYVCIYMVWGESARVCIGETFLQC